MLLVQQDSFPITLRRQRLDSNYVCIARSSSSSSSWIRGKANVVAALSAERPRFCFPSWLWRTPRRRRAPGDGVAGEAGSWQPLVVVLLLLLACPFQQLVHRSIPFAPRNLFLRSGRRGRPLLMRWPQTYFAEKAEWSE